MTIVKWGLALVLGLFLIAFGVTKFTGAHIFQFIEANAAANGLPFAGLFHPVLNTVVGVVEIIAGVLIIWPATRAFGAMLGSAVIAGAVAFHLSPYLGVNTPGGFSAISDGAPWTATDFTDDRSPILFGLAVVMLAVAVTTWLLSRRTS